MGDVLIQRKDLKKNKMKMQLHSLYGKIVFGIVALNAGLALLVLKSWIVKYVADSILILRPNSFITTIWQKPPEVTVNAYFFNWTNSHDFHNLSIKPKLEELGPYRYKQRMEKVNIVWNDNDTVSYNQVLTWFSDDEQPNGNPSDVITTVDVLLTSAAHYMRHSNYFIKTALSALFATNGYSVVLNETINNILTNQKHLLIDLSNYFPFLTPDIPKFESYGLLTMRNGSETFDGTFNVANGINGNFDVLNWNFKNVTPYFSGACSKIRGSATELYSRKSTEKYIDVFVADLCRTVRLDFEEEVDVDGIKGHKYIVGPSLLDNGTLVSENVCQCAGDCVPMGMINVSSCRYGFPLLASLPHFYGADPVYLNAVEGLQPEKEKHEAYIILEPETRILLKAAGRFQMNVLLKPIEGITIFQDVRKLFFPTAWGEQVVELPKSQRLLLKIYLASPSILLAFSVMLILLGIYLTVFATFRSKLPVIYKGIKKHRASIQPYIKSEEEVPLNGEVDTRCLKLIVDSTGT